MNIQAMMKQAQKLQKDMMGAKEEIDNTIFESKKSFLTMTAKGDKKIMSVKLDIDEIAKDDIETIEDLILVTCNDLMEKIDKETEAKMGKFSQGMPGLF
ncbi:MAG: YbaB/EbfC family nucleoid-associated protein [Bacilli bacterium]